MYDRIKKLCEDNGTNITALCKEVTNSTGNSSTWKKGNIRADYLIKICQKFNVSSDYILLGKNPLAESLNPYEIQLIEYYRLLNEDNQKKAIGQVRDLTKVAEYRKDTEIAEETHVDAGKRAM